MLKKPRQPKSLRSLLAGGNQLRQFRQMLVQQAGLLQEIRELLPAPLDEHCLHARISSDQLILQTDSPAWSSRLRFHGPRLIQQLRRQAPNLRNVRVFVHPDTSRQPLRSRKATLSYASAAIIDAAADATSDPELRAALRRLGQRRKN